MPDLRPLPLLPIEHHTTVFRHGRLTMAVHRYGHGPHHVLAFHGFGRTGADMAAIASALQEQCTIHAFDLPFHGQSPAPDGTAPLAPEEWTDCITAYVAGIPARTVSLMGYSLGGRLALVLLERTPALLHRVFLLAPDGLTVSPWFRRMVRYPWGRALGRRFIRHPGIVHGLLNLLHRTGLLHERLYRFLMDQTATAQIRTLVYQVWDNTRLLEPHLASAAHNAQARGILVHLFLGEHDRVIKPRYGKRLQRHAPDHVKLHLLPTGHQMLTKTLGEQLGALLNP